MKDAFDHTGSSIADEIEKVNEIVSELQGVKYANSTSYMLDLADLRRIASGKASICPKFQYLNPASANEVLIGLSEDSVIGKAVDKNEDPVKRDDIQMILTPSQEHGAFMGDEETFVQMDQVDPLDIERALK